MTCAEAEARFAEIAGGELDGDRADEARAHADGCASCGRVLAELEMTIALARKAGVEPLPDGFQLELHKKLVAAGAPRESFLQRLRDALVRRPFLTAAASAALAACLAAGGTALVLQRRSPTELRQIAARVPSSKVALVKIDFVAERAVDDVDFEIMLPDGLQFYSGKRRLAERTFRWSGKLEAGSNPIPIAVKGTRAGRFRVIAHATGKDLDVTHEVWLEVTA